MNTIIWIGLIAGALTIIAHFLGVLKWIWAKVQKGLHVIARYRKRVPRETVRIVAMPQRLTWEMTSIDGKQVMSVSGRWFVTNITNQPVRLLKVCVKRPYAESDVLIENPMDYTIGDRPIPPTDTKVAVVHFSIAPPMRKEGKKFNATVIFIDQFGNKHEVKKVTFSGIERRRDEDAGLPRERIYSIADPIEKEIVAVLKSEVDRYRQCGRKVGGLGSVICTYKGKKYPGVGTEWREADSPKNQSVVLPSDTAPLESDNADVLLVLYKTQDEEPKRKKFVNDLLNRLSRDTEYAPVGYLILLVLFRIARLQDALDTAKRELQNDEKHGFSDFLRLLDGMLRFEHTSFTLEQLDAIDEFIDGTIEHTFSIEERIAAIHASRLRNQGD